MKENPFVSILVALLLAPGCAGEGPSRHDGAVSKSEGGVAGETGPAGEAVGFPDGQAGDVAWASDGSVNGINFYQKGLIATTWDTSTGGKMLLVDRVLVANYCKLPPGLSEVLYDFSKVQYSVAIAGASQTGSFTVDGSKVTAVFQKLASLNSSTGEVTWTEIAEATSGTVTATTSGNSYVGTGKIAGTYDLVFAGGKLEGTFSGTLCWAEVL
jgi:hypothetical protein